MGWQPRRQARRPGSWEPCEGGRPGERRRGSHADEGSQRPERAVPSLGPTLGAARKSYTLEGRGAGSQVPRTACAPGGSGAAGSQPACGILSGSDSSGTGRAGGIRNGTAGATDPNAGEKDQGSGEKEGA